MWKSSSRLGTPRPRWRNDADSSSRFDGECRHHQTISSRSRPWNLSPVSDQRHGDITWPEHTDKDVAKSPEDVRSLHWSRHRDAEQCFFPDSMTPAEKITCEHYYPQATTSTAVLLTDGACSRGTNSVRRMLKANRKKGGPKWTDRNPVSKRVSELFADIPLRRLPHELLPRSTFCALKADSQDALRLAPWSRSAGISTNAYRSKARWTDAENDVGYLAQPEGVIRHDRSETVDDGRATSETTLPQTPISISKPCWP
jgi:hypothetical protein